MLGFYSEISTTKSLSLSLYVAVLELAMKTKAGLYLFLSLPNAGIKVVAPYLAFNHQILKFLLTVGPPAVWFFLRLMFHMCEGSLTHLHFQCF